MSRYALTEEFERLLGQPIVERGQNAMVRCPFGHEDRTPSLSIDLERGLWVCFSCGERGSIFSLAHRLEQEIDETSVLLRAYEATASPYYVEPPDFASQSEEYHQHAWRTQAPEVVRYIIHKGLSPKVFRHFKLGWTGKAISMPYYTDSKVSLIRYRGPDGFKWSEAGGSRIIYNVNDVRAKDIVILAEGESDTHRLWSAFDQSGNLWHNLGIGGIPGVGKGQPSRSTWELWLLEVMWAKRVYIAFDADEAGDSGAVTPLQILGDKGVRIRPTKGKDICDHFKNGGTLAELGLDEEDVHVLGTS